MDGKIMPDSENDRLLKRTTYKIGLLVLVLIGINLILNQLIPLEGYELLKSDGSRSTVDEMRKMNSMNTVLKIPFLGFVLGALLSFIPFKKMRYKEKYLRCSLFVILVLSVFQLVSYVRLLI